MHTHLSHPQTWAKLYFLANSCDTIIANTITFLFPKLPFNLLINQIKPQAPLLVVPLLCIYSHNYTSYLDNMFMISLDFKTLKKIRHKSHEQYNLHMHQQMLTY